VGGQYGEVLHECVGIFLSQRWGNHLLHTHAVHTGYLPGMRMLSPMGGCK